MEKIIDVKNLTVSFRTVNGKVQAVRNIDFHLEKGETLCLVGESGSGKSVTCRAILGILAPNAIIESGQINYREFDLVATPERKFHHIRGARIGMIFQDPLSALNPVMRIGKQIAEAVIINQRKYIKNALKENNIKILNNEAITLHRQQLEQKKDALAVALFEIGEQIRIRKGALNGVTDKEQVKAQKAEIKRLKKELKEKRHQGRKEIAPLARQLRQEIKGAKRQLRQQRRDHKVELREAWGKAGAANKVDRQETEREIEKIKEEIRAKVKEMEEAIAALQGSGRQHRRRIAIERLKIGSIKEEGRGRIKKLQQQLRDRQDQRKVAAMSVCYATWQAQLIVDNKHLRAKRWNIWRQRREAKEKALSLMKEVGITNYQKRYRQFPFQFSGGMRQRIVIAIALAANPEVLICDEPTTALDVTIQAQILELISDLKKTRDLSVIFITHDLGVVANMADRVAIMYAGKIVEYGTSREIFYDARHPYTWALLSSMPSLLTDVDQKLEAIPGTPPNMIHPPVGDAFAPRNKYAMQIDFEEHPPFFKVSDSHYAATWLLHPDAPKVDRKGGK